MPQPHPRHISLCGKKLKGLRHVCGFFESEEKMYEVIGPYLKEGSDGGDQGVTILESQSHTDHLARLHDAGVDVFDAMARNQLKVLASEESYIKDEVFVVDRMYGML